MMNYHVNGQNIFEGAQVFFTFFAGDDWERAQAKVLLGDPNDPMSEVGKEIANQQQKKEKRKSDGGGNGTKNKGKNKGGDPVAADQANMRFLNSKSAANADGANADLGEGWDPAQQAFGGGKHKNTKGKGKKGAKDKNPWMPPAGPYDQQHKGAGGAGGSSASTAAFGPAAAMAPATNQQPDALHENAMEMDPTRNLPLTAALREEHGNNHKAWLETLEMNGVNMACIDDIVEGKVYKGWIAKVALEKGSSRAEEIGRIILMFRPGRIFFVCGVGKKSSKTSSIYHGGRWWCTCEQGSSTQQLRMMLIPVVGEYLQDYRIIATG